MTKLFYKNCHLLLGCLHGKYKTLIDYSTCFVKPFFSHSDITIWNLIHVDNNCHRYSCDLNFICCLCSLLLK